MSSSESDGVTLSVRAAEKGDAGRGVARIPEPVRRQLGILSGDAVVIDGEESTVAKMWPADPSVPDTPPFRSTVIPERTPAFTSVTRLPSGRKTSRPSPTPIG